MSAASIYRHFARGIAVGCALTASPAGAADLAATYVVVRDPALTFDPAASEDGP